MSTPVESEKKDEYPKLQSFEETIARYGQICLWLRNMSRWSNKPKQKTKLKLLMQLAINEFEDTMNEYVKLLKLLKEKADTDAKVLEDNAVNFKGQKIKELFGEF